MDIFRDKDVLQDMHSWGMSSKLGFNIKFSNQQDINRRLNVFMYHFDGMQGWQDQRL